MKGIRIAKQATIQGEINDARELVRREAEAEITLLNETHHKQLSFRDEAYAKAERMFDRQMGTLLADSVTLKLLKARLPAMGSTARREIEAVVSVGK